MSTIPELMKHAREAMQKLAAALRTPEVKKFIEDKYKGAIVAAF